MIVGLGAEFGVGSGILPPGRRRLSATCYMVSLSKSTKLSKVVIPSFTNCATVFSSIPICAEF